MDFSARLKRKHLNDIIQNLKYVDIPEEVDEEEKDENFEENCLFVGLMPEEDTADIRIAEMFNHEKKIFVIKTPAEEDEDDSDTEVPRQITYIYDPVNIKSEFDSPNKSAYSPALLKELDISKIRYNHYLSNPEAIRPNEISKYNKEWMSNALNLVYPSHLLKQYSSTVKSLFQEVLDTYTFSMKKAILDYILRSPAERKRLHILMIPREVPTSSYKIALKGGFNTNIFHEWHQARLDTESEIKIKLICNNIVMGSLTSWWHNFRDIKLFKFDGLKEF